MLFYISDSFTDSLKRLSNTEQKQIKTTIFDLQTNPSHPALQFHRIEKAKDPYFWSIRVSDDIRCILHKKEETILVCYVDHHDKAYSWAEKRKIEVHPKTGAVQIVSIPEITVDAESHLSPLASESLPLKKSKPLFSNISDDDILSLGVPKDWISKIKNADEDSIFDYLEVLPAEAGEALLDLAYGKKFAEKPIELEPSSTQNPYEHPDSLRRFKLITNEAELEQALLASWSKWSIFLHPKQRALIEKNYNGPVRISGSAGTGKTVVALHRALYLARSQPESRILVSTFSEILLSSLRQNFLRLASNDLSLGERVEFQTLETVVRRQKKRLIPGIEILGDMELLHFLEKFWNEHSLLGIPKNLVLGEVLQVLNAWNLPTWDDYKKFPRLGRRARLQESEKKLIWNFFESLRNTLADHKQYTLDSAFFQIADMISKENHSIFDSVVLDEAQDLTPAQLYFTARLTKQKENLFFTGDLGQRIFQIPFSWKQLGIEIRGRAHTLRINYRTSEQIRKSADRLLDSELSDYDGNKEARTQTFSVFQGPPPERVLFDSIDSEIKGNSDWITNILGSSIGLGEILVIVRSDAEKERAKSVFGKTGLAFVDIANSSFHAEKISLSNMHLAKGLEFRAVLIMACDSDILPLSGRLALAADEAELEEVYATERHLLYVACTRARDILRITGLKPGSEFLEDMG